MGFSLVMPLWHFLDPWVEALSLLPLLGGAREADFPLPSAADAPPPPVEVGVVLALVVAVRAPVVWRGG